MFHTVTSSRIERLHEAVVQDLIAALREGNQPLWKGPTLIVPNLAVARALSRSLAVRRGVCMGLEVDFLAPWLWRTMHETLGDVAPTSPFEVSALTWRVLRLLDDQAWVAKHPRLHHHLAGWDGARKVELAEQVSGLFARYTLERSDWLRTWAAGVEPGSSVMREASGADAKALRSDEAWLAALWQRLGKELPAVHDDPVSRMLALLEKPNGSPRDRARIQALLARQGSVHVVAPMAMASRQVQMLSALALHIDVHLYWLNPCEAFWFDYVESKALARAWVRAIANPDNPRLAARVAHAEVGHALLGSWAKPWRSMGKALVEHVQDEHQQLVHLDHEPDSGVGAALQGTRLQRLQASLRVGDDQSPLTAWQDLSTSTSASLPNLPDESLEIHVTSTLRRQLEALHERLLARLNEPSASRSRLPLDQVLVAVPDIDAAAPIIDAVFGNATGSRQLAYNITGHTRESHDGGAGELLLQLTASASSRWTASDIDELCRHPLVAHRMGWGEDELRGLSRSLVDAGMHFGLDAEHRKCMELPAQSTHTLAHAMDRWLLGSLRADAQEADDEAKAPMPSRVPLNLQGSVVGAAPDHSSQRQALLPALAQLERLLLGLRRELQVPRPAQAWRLLWLALIDRFMAPPDEATRAAIDALRASLASWVDQADAAHSGERALDARTAHALLSLHLRQRRGAAVPGGGITFAPVHALLGLPMACVAVLGLEHGGLPRSHTPLEFDLAARAPRDDDRRPRDEDRQALLALTLSARQHLWLFYGGKDPQTYADRPPSPLVDELVASMARIEGTTPQVMRQWLVTHHPLQPFDSSLYRSDAPVQRRSHDNAIAQGLQAKLDAGHTAPSSTSDDPWPHTAQDVEWGDGDDEEDQPEEASDARQPAVEETAIERRHATRLWSEPLPPSPPVTVSLRELQRFFANPAKRWLQRLGVALPYADHPLEDDEPFEVAPLFQRPLITQWAQSLRHGSDEAQLANAARTLDAYPQGALQEPMVRGDLHEAQQLAQEAGRAVPSRLVEGTTLHIVQPSEIKLALLVADVPIDAQHERVIVTASKLSAKHLLNVWLEHLALAVMDQDARRRSTLITRDRQIAWRGLTASEAEGHLRALMALLAQGLMQPLPFDAQASLLEAELDDTLKSKRKSLRLKSSSFGAAPVPEADLAWRGHPPLSSHAAFQHTAQAVFGPLLEALDLPKDKAS